MQKESMKESFKRVNSEYKPLISTIIPYYNTKLAFFKDTIESLLSQSYINWEAIIVNDGSNIKSRLDLENFINNINDKRISIINLDKNSGTSVACNLGIEASKGDIITQLDSDDLYLPWCYEDVKNSFLSNPNCSILFQHCYFYLDPCIVKKIWVNNSFSKLLNELNRLKKEEKLDYLLKKVKVIRGTICPIIFLKREIFTKICFDPELKAWEDTDLHLQIFNTDEFLENLITSSKIGYLYRIHSSGNRVSTKVDLELKAKERMIDKYRDENIFAYKMISHWQSTSNGWKFCKLVNEYLQSGSILRFLKGVFYQYSSLKDRIKAIRFLLDTILQIYYSRLNTRFKLTHFRLVFLKVNNEIKNLEKIFRNYLGYHRDEKTKFYAERIYKRIF